MAFVGITISNALQEQIKIGDKYNFEYKDKYTLAQLLDPKFRLPAQGKRHIPDGSAFEPNGVATILALAQQPHSGIKQYKYVGPENGKA